MATNKTIQKSISINAQVPDVWEALTKPEKIKEWLFGSDAVSDWKVGSPIIFKGVWEGKAYEDKGRILQFEPGKILEYSYWSGFSGMPDEPENYSIVTFELAPTPEGTDLQLSQRNFSSENQCEDSAKNWDFTLVLMKKLIEKLPGRA